MTTTASKELEEILLRADHKSLRQILRGKTEDQRKPMARVAISYYRKAWSDRNYAQLLCALNALLITATAEQIDKVSFAPVGIGELDLELLAEQKPSIMQHWLEGRIAQHRIEFKVVAELVERGLCVEPDTEDYVIHLMGSLVSRSSSESVVSLLGNDQRFLNHYVWRLFEVEGNGENSLAANDRHSTPDATWEFALLQLSREGKLPRDRLLDASLEALDRGFLQFRSNWYSRFHESLEPTIAERKSRVAAYANLAASSIPTTVSFALNALNEIARSAVLPPDLLIGSLEPALSAKAKSAVLAVLSLIELTIKSKPDSATPLCCLAARALLHESPEVQAKIIKLITKYATPESSELRYELQQYRDCLAPSVRKMIDAWLKDDVSGEPLNVVAVAAGETYKEHAPRDLNPLDTAARIEPFQSLDELIAGCSYSLEHPSEVIKIERAIDGIVSLCTSLPPDFAARSAPLKKRALFIREHRSESITFLQRLFAGFVYCWLTDDLNLPYRPYYENASQQFVHGRLSALLERIVKRTSLPILSAPTHERGWIEPSMLVRRWQQFTEVGQIPDDYDQAIALLRMPLAQLEQLLPTFLSLAGEFWDAVRFAKGRSDVQGNNKSRLWLAAGSYRKPVKPAALFSLGNGALYQGQWALDSARCMGSYFPAIRNQFVASGIKRVGSAIDGYSQSEQSVRAYVEVLLDPAFTFDQPAYHLLAAGLIISDPECAGVARDALIRLIDASQLNVEHLGKEIGVFLYCGRSKTKRLVEAMADVARIGGRHSSAVRQVLERALQGGEVVPRNISTVLELLNELLHAEGMSLDNPVTKQHLRSLGAGGKSGKLVRELIGERSVSS